jgi:dipeptidyl aminopeptidase/acylaminoacyl peptidase
MELIFETTGEFWYAADWSHDAKTLLLGRYVSINESYFALLDVATRERTDLTLPDGQIAAIGNLRFAPDGRSIYITTDARGEFNSLARYDMATKEYQWLTEDIDWNVSDLEVHAESGQVAFAVNEDGASRLYLLEGDTPRPLPLPLGIVSSIEFSPDGKQLGFTLSRPDAPADTYSLSLADEQLTRWTFSEVGGLNPDSFIAPQRIQFKSFDARTIPAYYFKPRGASPANKAPVVISIHGGPESQYQPYFSGTSQYYVNDLGFAVIAPNVRGSAGYGKTYLKLDNAELREDSVKDIGALLNWIAQQPELDESRVAVVGGSYGGYMVLASLIHYGDRLKAGIDIVGIASCTTFLSNTAAYRQDLRRAEYGDETDPQMQAVFKRIDPTSNADKIRSALLVAHGVNDPRVPFSEAQQIADKVRSQGRPVWTVYADNEGHGFGKKDNADYLRAVQVMFLKQHLSE